MRLRVDPLIIAVLAVTILGLNWSAKGEMEQSTETSTLYCLGACAIFSNDMARKITTEIDEESGEIEITETISAEIEELDDERETSQSE